MRSEITPVILTYNEAPNIGRNLKSLSWASDVVVVDSFSTDETPAIVKSFPNTRLFQRVFDSHAAQWNFALRETGIKTDWVLALDADHILTEEGIQELNALSSGDFDAYRARFRYCIGGRPLRASAYPALTLLFKRKKSSFIQDGHTQKIRVDGRIGSLKETVLHDDRKTFSRWLRSQTHYMKLEVDKLTNLHSTRLSWPDRIRRWRVVAPLAVFVYCLFGKGLILDGVPGVIYSTQRMMAEVILSFYLMDHDVRSLMGRTSTR